MVNEARLFIDYFVIEHMAVTSMLQRITLISFIRLESESLI